MRERLRELARRAGARTAALALLALLVSGPAFYQLFLAARLYAARFNHPWDIEWNEGPMLYQAFRMMHGQMAYGPPSIGYLPIMHPFLYYAIVAVVGLVTGGVSYGVGRSVTFFFFLLACALFLRVFTRDEAEREEDGSRLEGLLAGLLAAGTMAAGVPPQWFLLVATPAKRSPPRLSWFHNGRFSSQLAPPSRVVKRPPGKVPAWITPG